MERIKIFNALVVARASDEVLVSIREQLEGPMNRWFTRHSDVKIISLHPAMSMNDSAQGFSARLSVVIVVHYRTVSRRSRK